MIFVIGNKLYDSERESDMIINVEWGNIDLPRTPIPHWLALSANHIIELTDRIVRLREAMESGDVEKIPNPKELLSLMEGELERAYVLHDFYLKMDAVRDLTESEPCTF